MNIALRTGINLNQASAVVQSNFTCIFQFELIERKEAFHCFLLLENLSRNLGLLY
jgi:hypothetical protein